MLIVIALPIVPAPALTELERGIVESVNEFLLIVNVPGDHPPPPLNVADKANDFLPSLSCLMVTVLSISIIELF